ncbi:MAG: nucleoside-diphosphate kinase [Treponema sp.]|jgi:nucleoside diphosphate kinase|nr:nucleoside-diphosphate kinase [Treponema sp.]
MKDALSYVLVTPYTVAKSRTGGVMARLLSRLDLELAGAQMIAPDKTLVGEYAAQIRAQARPSDPGGTAAKLLAEYVEKNLYSEGRGHRTLLLVFRGKEPTVQLSQICGALYSENRGLESITGETIRDTYADMIYSPGDPSRVSYFEPAVLTARSQETADENLRLFSRFLAGKDNIVHNIEYPDPSKIEQTLVIIKPDNWNYASSKPGTIIDMFSRTGLRIVAIKLHRFSLSQALLFYGSVKEALRKKLAPGAGERAKELLEKEFGITLNPETAKIIAEQFGTAYAEEQFGQIVGFMSGATEENCRPEDRDKPGPVKCMLLLYEGEGAINKIREVLGPTDPLKAPGGTVRRDFGSNVMVNTAHASDSMENSRREQGIVKINENGLKSVIDEYLDGR